MQTMKAFVAERYQRGNTLGQVELPLPPVGDNDVLVRIEAAAVNLLDAKLRSGEFKLILPYPLPLVAGHAKGKVVLSMTPG